MEVYIPSFRYEESDLERGYTVFKIEVLMNGRKHFVEKRYSEFHALHKKLKKCIKTPEIPSKHVRNWVPKVLEQRRQGLETYLQGVLDNIALSGVRELFSSFDTMWKEHFLQTYNLRPMILAHKQLLSVLHLGESKHIHTHGWREGQRDGRMNALVDGKTLRVIRYFDSISLYSKASLSCCLVCVFTCSLLAFFSPCSTGPVRFIIMSQCLT
nr:sorting nexin-24 isoform X2 [Pan paniscus]